MEPRIYPIARGSSAPLWFCGIIGLLTLGLGAFLGTLSVFGSRLASLEVSDGGVRIDAFERLEGRAAVP